MKPPFARKFIPRVPGQTDVGDAYARKRNAAIEPVQKRKKEAAEKEAAEWLLQVKARKKEGAK